MDHECDILENSYTHCGTFIFMAFSVAAFCLGLLKALMEVRITVIIES